MFKSEKYYKVVRKGSKRPITQFSMSGPQYRGRPCIENKQTHFYDSYMSSHAWYGFIQQAKFSQYRDIQLLFDNKVIAEAYRNPTPEDEWDIYRIKLMPSAPKELKDFVLQEIKDGVRFVSENY